MVRLLETVSAQAHKRAHVRVITTFQEKQTSYYEETEVVLIEYLPVRFADGFFSTGLQEFIKI